MERYAADSHRELSFSLTEFLHPYQRGIAHNTLPSELGVRGKFHLNTSLGADLRQVAAEVVRMAGNQNTIPMHVGRCSRNCSAPLRGKRQLTR